jgi:hypothetical protein
MNRRSGAIQAQANRPRFQGSDAGYSLAIQQPTVGEEDEVYTASTESFGYRQPIRPEERLPSH